MSDGTPTESLGSAGDAPTVRLPEAATPAAAASPGLPPQPTSRRLLVILAIIGVVLLLALLAVIALLLTRSSGAPAVLASPSAAATADASPSPSPMPSLTPSSTPTPTATTQPAPPPPPPPPDTSPAFTKFDVPKTEDGCSSGGPYYTPPPIKLKVSWATKNGQSVWFVYGSGDAADSAVTQLPLAGNQDDFPYEVDFPCGSAGQSYTYTMTIVGTDGSHKSKTWEVKDTSHY